VSRIIDNPVAILSARGKLRNDIGGDNGQNLAIDPVCHGHQMVHGLMSRAHIFSMHESRHWLHAFSRQIRQQALQIPPGRLIAISSVLGKWGVGGGQAAYCASKAGVHGLVRAAAVELGPRQITRNAVCPGWVDTPMAQARFRTLAAEAGTTPEAIAIEARHEVPTRRFVEVDEVAGVVAFLCSPVAAMITGQAISICGGATTFAG